MTRSARPVAVFAAAVVAGAIVSGCGGRGDLDENAAEVSFGDRRAELQVASCGLDDDVFILAASSADLFLQLLLVVTGDEEGVEVDLERSGVTLEVAREGVVGAGDAGLLEAPPAAVGVIESATVRGDRIDLVAEAKSLPSPVGDSLEDARIEVAARCSEAEDLALGRDFIATQETFCAGLRVGQTNGHC